MRERPIQDLLDALGALGADCEARSPGGCPPVRVAGGGLPGGAIYPPSGRMERVFGPGLLTVMG